MTAKPPTSSRNRILALFPELQGFGGVQEAGRLTAAALTDIASTRGCPLDLLSLNDSPGRQSLPATNGSIPFVGFGRAKARFVLAALARAQKGARFVLAAHPHLALPAAQLKLFQSNIKLAVISHGVEVWHRLPPLRRSAFLKADVFVAPSCYTLDKIVEVQGALPKKTKRIAWPLNPDFLRLAEKPEALPLPPGFPQGLAILSVARLAQDERYKGVDQLIRAIAQLPADIQPVHLVVVAGGDDLPRHRALAAELAIAPRVHFFENLSPNEVAACYSRCDVFALPSTGEGFGFAFLEAMAFAKPALGAAAGGVTDIVEHGANGLLVSPGDLGQLVQSLEQLLRSESLRNDLGRKGAESVHSKYRFDAFRDELERLLFDCTLESTQSQ